jgi:hypothetical protein
MVCRQFFRFALGKFSIRISSWAPVMLNKVCYWFLQLLTGKCCDVIKIRSQQFLSKSCCSPAVARQKSKNGKRENMFSVHPLDTSVEGLLGEVSSTRSVCRCYKPELAKSLKVLRPANSIKVFRGFPWSQSEC